MDILLKEPVKNMNDVLPLIQHLFPTSQFQIPPLNKKRMVIYETQNKAAVALTLKDKGTRIRIKGEPNMKNPTNIGWMIFGIVCTFGMILALIMVHVKGGEERQQKALEAYELIKNELEPEYLSGLH